VWDVELSGNCEDCYLLGHDAIQFGRHIVSWAIKQLPAVALSFFERITHKASYTVNIFCLMTCTDIKYYGFFHAP